MIKKLISEFIGTALLVIIGCGTAVAMNMYVGGFNNNPFTYTSLIIALAFGLTLTALIYSIGKVSGCHVNPAVTLSMIISGRMNVIEGIEYMVVQVLGGIVGAETLGIIFQSYNSLGSNGYGELSILPTISTMWVALVIEAILTFIFALVILSVTEKENNHAGFAIGLTLVVVHIMGIPFTGTSVNPARSIGPALFTGGVAMNQLWVFIVAPLVGAALAALFYRFVIKTEEPTNKKK